MASTEKHKRRSCVTNRNNLSEFAGFARKTVIKNDRVKQARGWKAFLNNLKTRNKADT